MKETILDALVRLFALIAGLEESISDSREVVRSFLMQQLDEEGTQRFLMRYDALLAQQTAPEENVLKRKRASASSVKVLGILDQINSELEQHQKCIVLLRLSEIIFANGATPIELDFIETVASSFAVPDQEFLNLRAWQEGKSEEIEAGYFLVLSEPHPSAPGAGHLHVKGLSDSIEVLWFPSVNLFVLRNLSGDHITLNGHHLNQGRLYLLNPGSAIRSKKFQPVFYSEIEGHFIQSSWPNRIRFEVQDVGYTFKSGKVGLHPLSFTEGSGSLVGIMGGSGAGKSTLLNVLNGNDAPTHGRVAINGIDLHKEAEKLEGLIGYVPQDDLLLEQLTVYENLYFNACFCFPDVDESELSFRVLQVLEDVGLSKVAQLRVGSVLDKTISGGQRKRLNIALELIRKPEVLFLDEPTSGLSSRDSELIMDLLKGLTQKGKLVFLVIHQPASDIFKLFDRLLLLDQGGYLIYNGNPVESLVYFKEQAEFAQAGVSECLTCGNVNPEQLFSIVESTLLDETGQPTNKRKITSKQWHERYNLKGKREDAPAEVSSIAPESGRSKAGWWHQIKVYLRRDLRSKLSNKGYRNLTLLEAPALAVVLGWLCRNGGSDYVFRQNPNVPAFLFMSILVALFLGMILSAEEIFADRKMLRRERFLNLSWSAYLFSKTTLLFCISGIQAIGFTLLGNKLMGIQGMGWWHGFMYFSVSCLANLIGLNISSAFRSAVAIYILIPFLLIPQILLSGILIRFDDLNPALRAERGVPWVGNAMASRWAFEAMATQQFSSNAWEQPRFSMNMEIQQANYYTNYFSEKAEEVLGGNKGNEKAVVQAQIKDLLAHQDIQKTGGSALDDLKSSWSKRGSSAEDRLARLDEKIGNEADALRKAHENEALSMLVKNSMSLDKTRLTSYGIIPLTNTVYFPAPDANPFHAPLFSPEKQVGSTTFSTWAFNALMLWIMSAVLYLMLYFNVLARLLNVEGKRRPRWLRWLNPNAA
jgi:ABC-type multidrug transport system ATPase subunit